MIVLDLSHDQSVKPSQSNVLSDILQATGIANDSDEANDLKANDATKEAIASDQVQDEMMETSISETLGRNQEGIFFSSSMFQILTLAFFFIRFEVVSS